MPQRHEREDKYGRDEAVLRAPEGDIDVSRDPKVVAPVPGAPEAERGVVVRHAAHHVLRGVDPGHEGPETKEAPRDEELCRDVVRWVYAGGIIACNELLHSNQKMDNGQV